MSQEKVYELYNKGRNIFVTGKAGTGKSTLLREMVRLGKNVSLAVTSPTGMAAVNVGGQTIHSMFAIAPSAVNPEDLDELRGKKKKILRSLDVLVIDEVSMVRVDLFGLISARLREAKNTLLPFGGVQVVAFGDMFQLPPVVRDWQLGDYLDSSYGGPYFFMSHELQGMDMELVELEKIYRQSDPAFIALLNGIRTREGLHEVLDELNKRCCSLDDNDAVVLTATNKAANDLNRRRLSEISSPEFVFNATVMGEFPESSYPTDSRIVLKKGARVMMLRNDVEEFRWVNGSLGRVVDSTDTEVCVGLDNGHEVWVEAASWDNVKYDLVDGKIVPAPVGTFTQIPVKLAYAMTIHKSQGQTFDRVHIDLGRGSFSHGQTYVALSRCRSLEGITLEVPIDDNDVIVDHQVLDYERYFV